jgi:hypothetical protein
VSAASQAYTSVHLVVSVDAILDALLQACKTSRHLFFHMTEEWLLVTSTRGTPFFQRYIAFGTQRLNIRVSCLVYA